MQTFLPYPDFAASAYVLDNQRLNKQRSEAKTILLINDTINKDKYVHVCKSCKKVYLTNPVVVCKKCGAVLSDTFHRRSLVHYSVLQPGGYKLPWENHPAVKMWRDYPERLAFYGIKVCREWIRRGYKDNLLNWFLHNNPSIDSHKNPHWLGDANFHISHQSNLLRKNKQHYARYFKDIPDDLPYVWPV